MHEMDDHLQFVKNDKGEDFMEFFLI
jgi:hypothetical protein